MMKKMLLAFLVLGGLLLCGGFGVWALSQNDQPEPENILTSPVKVGSGPSIKPTKAIAKSGTVDEGIWEVGPDIAPGKYKTSGAVEGIVTLCSWTVKSGSEIVAIEVVDKPTAQGVVTLKKGQTFETNGCKPWERR